MFGGRRAGDHSTVLVESEPLELGLAELVILVEIPSGGVGDVREEVCLLPLHLLAGAHVAFSRGEGALPPRPVTIGDRHDLSAEGVPDLRNSEFLVPAAAVEEHVDHRHALLGARCRDLAQIEGNDEIRAPLRDRLLDRRLRVGRSWRVGTVTKHQRPAVSLLDDVCQLVGKEAPAALSVRSVLAAGEYDVGSQSVGPRPHHGGRFRRISIGVDPHAGEVVAETPFHEASRGGVEPDSAPTTHDSRYSSARVLAQRRGLVVGGRRRGSRQRPRLPTILLRSVPKPFLLLLLSALLAPALPRPGTGTTDRRALRPPDTSWDSAMHHPVGHRVRLLLQGIPWPAHGELGLNQTADERADLVQQAGLLLGGTGGRRGALHLLRRTLHRGLDDRALVDPVVGFRVVGQVLLIGRGDCVVRGLPGIGPLLPHELGMQVCEVLPVDIQMIGFVGVEHPEVPGPLRLDGRALSVELLPLRHVFLLDDGDDRLGDPVIVVVLVLRRRRELGEHARGLAGTGVGEGVPHVRQCGTRDGASTGLYRDAGATASHAPYRTQRVRARWDRSAAAVARRRARVRRPLHTR